MSKLQRIIKSPQDRFAQEVLEVLRRDDSISSCWVDKERFAIGYRRRGEESPGWIFLDNVFRECAGVDIQERKTRIRYLISTVTDTDLPKSWAEIRPGLRPALRPITYGQSSPRGRVPLSRPAMPFLGEFVVVDRPTSMAYVTPEMVRQWDVDVADVFAAAHENMAETAHNSLVGSDEAIVRLLDNGDSYLTSLLLLDGWLAAMGARLGGRAVAFVADQNAMLLTIDDPIAVAALLPSVETEYQEAVRHISPVAYTTDDTGKVVPYSAPQGHPTTAAVHRANVLLATHTYHGQAEALQHRLDTDDEMVYVAGLIMLASPAGTVFTVASWSDGVHALLPKADYVAFTAEPAPPMMVPWSAVADLFPPPRYDPPRYEVTGWPDASTMERLQAQAVEP